MISGKLKIPFFTDNDVADGVGDLLSDSGHELYRLRHYMLSDTPDPVVAAVCRAHGLVLVTHNIKHFRAIVRQHEITKAETEKLCRIELGCEQVRSVERMMESLPLIEFEWDRMGPEKRGLRIYVGDGVIRVHR